MVYARALIDTGSDITVVSSALLRQLRATPLGSAQTSGIGGSTPVQLYEASLFIFNASNVHSPWIVRPDLTVMELPGTIEFDVLIGMDVLRDCTLVVSGPMGQFTLDG